MRAMSPSSARSARARWSCWAPRHPRWRAFITRARASTGCSNFPTARTTLAFPWSGSLIFVPSFGDHIQALDAASGERAWQRRVEARLVAGVGVGAGMVVVGDAGGMVSAFDTDSGDRLWSVQVGGDVSARPVIAIGRVIVRTADGQILGLDSATGEILWRVRRTVPSLLLPIAQIMT